MCLSIPLSGTAPQICMGFLNCVFCSNEDGFRDDFDMIGDDLAEEMKLVVKTENRF